MNRFRSERGLSLVEMLAVLVVLATLALVTAPPLIEIVRSSRLRAATRQLAGDIQAARARAVGTGWQYRIAGVCAGAGSARSNQYRVMSRQSAAVTWPDSTTGPAQSATLVVGEWIDVASLYPGIAINQSDTAEFGLTFNPQGGPTEMSLNFNPLQVSSHAGADKWLTVSAVGKVRVD